MALMFGTGFTGMGRYMYEVGPSYLSGENTPTPAFNSLTTALSLEGVKLFGSTGVRSGTGAFRIGVEADAIFPDRNRFFLNKDPRAYSVKLTGNYYNVLSIDVGSWRKGLDAVDDMVFGFTITPQMTLYKKAGGYSDNMMVGFAIGSEGLAGPSAVADNTSDAYKSVGPRNPNECYFAMTLNELRPDGVTDPVDLVNADRASFQKLNDGTAKVEGGALTHIELRIERKKKRIRTYVNGNLYQDVSYSGVFGDNLTRTLNIVLWQTGTRAYSVSSGPETFGLPQAFASIGDIYALEVDNVHTGPLGPAARVVEVKPTADADVNFIRSGSLPNNSAVAAQNYDGTDKLAADRVGAHDLYEGLSAVSRDAAKVFALGVKYVTNNTSGETHTMAPIVGFNGKNYQGAGAIIPATAQLMGGDITVNPTTGKPWAVSDLSTLTFGPVVSS